MRISIEEKKIIDEFEKLYIKLYNSTNGRIDQDELFKMQSMQDELTDLGWTITDRRIPILTKE